MSVISNLIRKSIKHSGPLNILTFFYDGRFDIEILKTGHNFYGLMNHSYPWPGFYDANEHNLHLIQTVEETKNLDLDLILFNNRASNQQFFHLCRFLHLPAIIVDHDVSKHNTFFLDQIQQQFPVEAVSTSPVVQKQFKHSININYGIEQKRGEYEKDIDILISGNFADQDLFILNTIKQQFPTLKLVGHNPNVAYSEMVDTFEDYKNLFKRTKIFINLAIQGNLSYELLWCLQYKCIPITCQTPAYSQLLVDNENCILVNGLEQIISAVRNLSRNKEVFNKLVNHKTDLSQFNQETFIKTWSDLLEGYRYKTYND